jgi:hypothetical protein
MFIDVFLKIVPFMRYEYVENFFFFFQDTDDNIIGRMRISRWVPKATNTHFRNIIRSFVFTLQTMVARTRLKVTSYVVSLVFPSRNRPDRR